MYQHVEGKTLTLVAPAGGVAKGVPLKHGEMVVVPATTALEGQFYTAYPKGVWSDFPLDEDAAPTYGGEAAYFKDGKFTTDNSGAVKVGYFANASGQDSLVLTGA